MYCYCSVSGFDRRRSVRPLISTLATDKRARRSSEKETALRRIQMSLEESIVQDLYATAAAAIAQQPAIAKMWSMLPSKPHATSPIAVHYCLCFDAPCSKSHARSLCSLFVLPKNAVVLCMPMLCCSNCNLFVVFCPSVVRAMGGLRLLRAVCEMLSSEYSRFVVFRTSRAAMASPPRSNLHQNHTQVHSNPPDSR